MEKFEYGELVEVRDYKSEEWFQRYYVATVEFPDTGKKWYCTHSKGAKANDHHDGFDCWHKIRKIQKPEPELIDIEQPETIEQRMDKFEAILNNAIKRINEQIQSIKNQPK
jgi:hypothetical protein